MSARALFWFQVRSILSGDSSLSVLELWGAEYQENCALLLKTEHVELFKQICAREQSPSCFLGQARALDLIHLPIAV
eukprot:996269-Pleurochrysis_carterae.AAC.1